MSNLEIITNTNFDNRVLKNTKVVLVDFFASWCGPCRMLTPILEQVASESKGDFEIVKMDIDDSIEIARKLNIMSVPTMIIYKDGKIVEKLIGLRQKSQILETLKKYI